VPPPTATPTWVTYPGFTYGDDVTGTIASSIENTLLDCQNKCGLGCDFYTYQANNKKCNIKYTDKASYMSTVIKGMVSGYLFGYLRGGGISTVATSTTTSVATCLSQCNSNANCQYVAYDTRNPTNVKCYLMRFQTASGVTLGFRSTVEPPNNSPATKGRFDVIGTAGVVAIAANLMRDGRVLLGARPEYDRGGPNTDNISPDPNRARLVPFGEIAAIFDPITGISTPSPIDDNIFCHGAVPAADGRIFTAGGDGGGDMNRDAAIGFTNGLRKLRYFDPATDQWTILNAKLQVTRWYPTVTRLTNGNYFIIGGLVDGATNFNTQMSAEIYDPSLPYTRFVQSRLLQRTGTGGYPFLSVIPQSGHIWAFAYRHMVVIDKDSGNEIDSDESGAGLVHGVRTGDYPGGGCLLPMREDASGFVKAERIFFGGVESPQDETTVTDVPRMVITDPIGSLRWTYDSDRMPYGRVVSDCVLYPNGQALIFNGARKGRTGGSIGNPIMYAAANDVFAFNPEAPAGQKFSVLAATPNQRFYHSNTMLVPDGRVLVMGTDEGTFFKDATAYNHDVEAFTPPWLLDGTPRPVITNSPTGDIKFGALFTISFTGSVDKVSIMTPQSSTHGTEMTQRLYFPTIVSRTATTMTLRAPRDATVMMQGDHMIFAVNGNTPSVAKWIRLMD
jgi:hypothetical protein